MTEKIEEIVVPPIIIDAIADVDAKDMAKAKIDDPKIDIPQNDEPKKDEDVNIVIDDDKN